MPGMIRQQLVSVDRHHGGLVRGTAAAAQECRGKRKFRGNAAVIPSGRHGECAVVVFIA
jgi:hypothetical protein